MTSLDDELPDSIGQGAAACPIHGGVEHQEPLSADDELIFPEHKRVFTHYVTREGEATELHLYYGEKEISFDEPELFSFGEALAKQSRFRAGTAVTWGAQYDWPRVRELLGQLLEEGILRRAATVESDADPSRERIQPSPLPPAQSTIPRTWLESEAIMLELTGHRLELGYLELVVPAYRVPHVVLDTEGRQVGEANVFPKALRLDVPTEWRTCPHPGSRYQHRLPMNVTAMKAMGVHWKQMMAALLRVREAYLLRFPQARAGWTVGDLHCLSTLVLSIPSYLMLRAHDRVENGQLDPVISSMYRVTDGVRMVMHYKLFGENTETTVPMNTPITSEEIYSYAERNEILISSTGVCAGSRAMIEEFLDALMHGRQVSGAESIALTPGVQAALNDIEAVFDYLLHGLQAYAVVFSRWIAMARAYEQLLPIVAEWPGSTSDRLHLFRKRLERSVEFLRVRTQQDTEERRVKRQQVYVDMHTRSANALGTEDVSLLQHLAPVPVGNDAQVRARLRDLLQRRLGAGTADEEAAVERVAEIVMGYFRSEQAIVRRATAVQQKINQLLGRAAPSRALTGADLAVHYRLLATIYPTELLEGVEGRLPYLVEDIEDVLGLRMVASGEAIGLEALSLA